MTEMDVVTTKFEENRRTLEGIAYRMLGSLSEAQDIVQNTYLKWREVDVQSVNNPRSWLITVCVRLALNSVQTARRRRETYFGIWLPEPLAAWQPAETDSQMEIDETVSLALMVSLEKLSPAERAAFILHDIFQNSFDEIAEILGQSGANCRQLASRARKRLTSAKVRFRATPADHERLLNGFLHAVRNGDLAELKTLLANDVRLYADGGGKAEAALEPMSGADAIARFFIEVWRRYADRGVSTTTRIQWFNGSPGMLILEDGHLATAMMLDVDDGRIRTIYAIRNPDKLPRIAR